MSAPGPFSYQWQFDGTNLPTSDIITTMAGNGSGGYSGDGIPAAGAELYDPADVAVDSQGNVYIADSINARVRKVSTNGIIATVAGNGTTGYAGDGGPATNAELNSPSGVAVDSQGNVYIADEANQRIRKVGTNGIIATLAGNSFNGYSGDGGQAANAELNSPSGVAVDSQGNAYIADAGNSCIREVATNGIITTMAGNGTNGYAGDGGSATNAELNGPAGVALDSNGNVYIADANNACVREVRKNGIITTVAGNGMTGYSGDDDVATNAELSFPEGVVVDGYGNLYIADADNSVIREVGQNGIITTVAGNGAAGYSGDNTNATETALDFPEGVAMDNQENLYIADLFNQRVRKVTDVNVSWPFTSALAVGNISSSNAGSYSLVISNSSGSITSSIASLTIVPLLIAPQPQNAEIVQSSNATFSVAASGVGPFGYQWQYNGTNLANGGQIGGSLTANLNISATTPGNAGNYQVIVTNIYGAVTSTVATLTILPPPQPAPVFGNSPDWGNSFEVSWASGISSGGAVGFTPLQNITLSGVTVWLSYYTGQYGQTNIVAIYNNALSSSAPANRPGAQITALRGPLPNDGTLAPFTFAYSSGQNVLRTNQEYWLLIEGNGTNPNIEVTSYWDGGGAPAGDVAYDGSVSLAGGSFEPSSVMPAFTINGTLPPPTVTARSFRGRIILTWPVGLNQIYQVQYTTNIFQPTWVNLGNPIITTNYILSVPDAANGSQRFYRILQE
jgi:sugar lactone lactonase YvrE